MLHLLQKVLLCFVLAFGSSIGVPMRAREIEELLRAMTQPKIAQTLSDEQLKRLKR